MSDAIPTLHRRFAEALDRLRPDGPVRFATLATAGLGGGASARMIVIRGLDEAAMMLRIHSHGGALKCAEIAADPDGTLLVWDPGARLQVRAHLALTVRPGTPEEWAALPAQERINYPATPVPGAPLADPEEMPRPDPAAFTVLTGRILSLDVLTLGRTRHLRARYDRSDGFAGGWIGP